MFREWGFLLGEIWFLLLLAGLLGLFAGWLIWGRRSINEGDVNLEGDLNACRVDLDKYRLDLDACRAGQKEKDDIIAALRADLAAAKKSRSTARAEAKASAAKLVDYDRDGVLEGKNEGRKPSTLKKPKGGKADDLKKIKGVGPQLEKLLHRLGFYHFGQIANWTSQEVAWVDANLEGFKGRVSRDHWVKQAKTLAAGRETKFSKRVEDGDVY